VSTARVDSVDFIDDRLDGIRLYFEKHGANTRELRRECLRLLPDGFYIEGALWLHAHPSDLWDTDEEEKRGWTYMAADGLVDRMKMNHAITGFWDMSIHGLEKNARTKEVGLTRERQEKFFSEEWFSERSKVWEK